MTSQTSQLGTCKTLCSHQWRCTKDQPSSCSSSQSHPNHPAPASPQTPTHTCKYHSMVVCCTETCPHHES
ncbi:hypothetical protein PRUPE_7G180300 [Prunus persica]|uniref:Uncharacterized protein n=1 Tax=Prunus persica TaxID=3760 RepID=A0A251ND43_PRUPE|nr:hypothetical protein PRUPE_7G180300 [Prunus persica]